MNWAGHTQHMGGNKNAYKTLTGKSEGKRPLKELGIDERIILVWVLNEHNVRVWIHLA
jgi:hypothetical protein